MTTLLLVFTLGCLLGVLWARKPYTVIIDEEVVENGHFELEPARRVRVERYRQFGSAEQAYRDYAGNRSYEDRDPFGHGELRVEVLSVALYGRERKAASPQTA